LRGILEKEFGVKVERWVTRDEDGIFYGFGSVIEIDIAVKDGKTMLIEMSSRMGPSDVAAFLRKAKLYERKTGIKPDRLIMVTPYAEDAAYLSNQQPYNNDLLQSLRICGLRRRTILAPPSSLSRLARRQEASLLCRARSPSLRAGAT
jgi:hypothetical protein